MNPVRRWRAPARSAALPFLVLSWLFALSSTPAHAQARADAAVREPGSGGETQPRDTAAGASASAYDLSPLTSAQRFSIELGAADLAGAMEQSFLSAFLYVSSATTLVVGIVTTIVLFAELSPPSLLDVDEWRADAAAALGTALGCFVAHAVTTPLAILVGRDAHERHDRARSELLLTGLVVTPFGVAATGSF